MFHLYGLLLGLGIVVGYTAAERTATPQQRLLMQRVALWMGVGAVVGARLYHLATDWQLYAGASLLDYLAIWRGGLAIYGAVGGAVLGCMAYLAAQRQLNRSALLTILDLLAFGLPLGQAIGRWGNYLNHELFGIPTSMPWGVFIPVEFRPAAHTASQYFHPLFFYESAAMCVLWIFLWKSRFAVGAGKILAVYLIGYGIVRFMLEFLRVESARLYGMPVAQAVSVLAVLIGCLVFYVGRKKSVKI